MPEQDTTNPVEALFLQTLELSEAERTAFLREQCGDNTEQLKQVEELLAAHEQTGSFVVDRQAEWETRDVGETASVGQQISSYTLREKIGEGGMGEVYVAEQEKPIARKVALKVIKAGMDSKSVLARFEAEQQALAMMNHRNIAKVLDAGMAPNGRPYFVMELVAGMPITEYCDEKKLNIEERLELFIQVCRAIQHAHQKGIIHRDIKPSNVLVTEEDGQAIPKVIDFGVAKALSQKLTDRTLYTNFQAFLGTPLYASPEQASLSNVDVDTRSDVYSLGVLLYELVTGSTPYNKDELQKAAYEEMCRIIREHEAVRPSTRLTSLGPSASTISQSRRSDPARLIQSVRGDLDWIVMKALEKDRGRRYEGASALAADIERMLGHEAIEARPPSAIYRITRFTQRNSRLVSLATAGAMLVFVSLGIVSWQYYRANRLLGEAQALVKEKTLLQACSGELIQVEETLEKYSGILENDSWTLSLRGLALLHSGKNEKAIDVLKEVTKEDPDDLVSQAILSVAYVHNGKWPEGLECAHQVESLVEASELDDFEKLLYGYSRMYIEPLDGANVLQEIIDEHPNWLMARVLRAGALGHVAERTRSIEDAHRAVSESQTVFALLPNNEFVQMMVVFAHNTALGIYQRNAMDTSALERSAIPVVESLSRKSDYALGLAMVAQYYDAVGDTDVSEKYWEIVGNLGAGFWSEFAIAIHYAKASTAETIKMIDSLPNHDKWEIRLAKSYVLADSTQSLKQAAEFFDQEVKTKTHPFRWYKGIQVLLLLGQADRAQKLAAEYLNAEHQGESILNERSALEVVASTEPPQLGETESGFQELLMAALWHIARGNREEAIRFLEATERIAFTDLSRYWSRAYLTKLQNDPSWPRCNPKMQRPQQADDE